MADVLKMEPARIARLRDPARLEHLDPDALWTALPAPENGDTLIDIGAGVGFLTLPLARRFPEATVVACDVLDGMVVLLAEDVARQGLENVRCLSMAPDRIPLDDGAADLVAMVQVHHELDDPPAVLADCRRVLAPGGRLVIVDWKDEDNPLTPPGGRRVPEATIRAQVGAAGFEEVRSHAIYRYHSVVSARSRDLPPPRDPGSPRP